MSEKKLNRRDFLRASAITAVGVLAASCAQPTPQVIEKPVTVIVQEQVPIEKQVVQTVVVEKPVTVEKVVQETVVVEKPVVQTVVVEKEKVVTPTALPSQFSEAPMLAAQVQAGKLPPVDERLPSSPIVITPYESIGKYGGTWHMVVQSSPYSHVAELLQYEGVLRYSAGGIDVLPNLAETWQMAPDGKEFVFNLRSGVKWSDGAPFNADDVVFWMEDQQGDPDLYSSLPAWITALGNAPEVAKIDDYTVRFTYTAPAPFLLRNLGFPNQEPLAPKHYLMQYHPRYTDQAKLEAMAKEKGFETWPQLYLNQANRDANPDLPVVYAWALSMAKEDGYVYTRNPYYWKIDTEGNQLPYIDSVETRVAANIEVAQMMCFSGEAELQCFGVGQFPADTMILKKNEQMGNYHVIDAPISEPNVCVFGLNLTCNDERLRNIFSDKNFRIALSHGVNREDIRQLVYLGQPKEIRQCAPLRESPFYHDAAAQNYVEYDPAKANQMLDDLGYSKRDSDGGRLAADGKPIAFTIEIIGKRNDYIDALTLVAQTWTNDLGLKVTAKAVETNLYFTRMRGNEHEAGVNYSAAGMFPPLDSTRYIPISNNAPWAPQWGIWYATKGKQGIEPPAEVKRQQELYDLITAEPEEDKQKAYWQEIMDINAENCYHFGICDRASVPTPVANTFHNVPDTGWNISWEAGNIGTTNPCQYWKEG